VLKLYKYFVVIHSGCIIPIYTVIVPKNAYKYIFKLVNIHSKPLHVFANHATVFRDVKYNGYVHKNYKMKLEKYQNQLTGIK
jgi:hypothetical protein